MLSNALEKNVSSQSIFCLYLLFPVAPVVTKYSGEGCNFKEPLLALPVSGVGSIHLV